MQSTKKVTEYIDILKKESVLEKASLVSCEDLYVKNLCYDSREVSKNTLFVCKGLSFKEEYISMAKEKGAIAFVSEIPYGVDNLILVKDVRRAMALLSALFYDSPWNDFKLVGLTGTKGKSTTLSYITNIMNGADVCGRDQFGYISTIDTYTGKRRFESHLTTPEAIELGKDLKEMSDSKLYAVGMEVSSQALKYDRTYGMTFDIGCFTNFSKDHIGSLEHPDEEDYFQSKIKFFDQCKTLVINLDTQRSAEVLDKARSAKLAPKIITYSSKDKSADYYIENIRKEDGLTKFSLTSFGEISLSMPGLFNAENAALAAIVSKLLGASNQEVITGLLNASANGRMEVFENKQRQLVVISDYAHNGASFERLFTSVKEEYAGYRIEAVFGAPGGRGLSRREDLPKVAAKYVDYCWITEDDPVHEDPKKICDELYENLIRFGGKGEIIVDREEAIKCAIKNAPPKTAVLLIAKGREQYMHRGDDFIPIKSDSQLAQELTAQ